VNRLPPAVFANPKPDHVLRSYVENWHSGYHRLGDDMGMKDRANRMKDKAMEKAKGALADDSNVDKAAEKADKASGGKYSDRINKAAEDAKRRNDKFSE
jgi:hypothetical protein